MYQKSNKKTILVMFDEIQQNLIPLYRIFYHIFRNFIKKLSTIYVCRVYLNNGIHVLPKLTKTLKIILYVCIICYYFLVW